MAQEEVGSDDRTEEATTQRREDFRRRGQVVQSRELASVLMLFGAALVLWGLGRFFLSQIMEIFNMSLGEYLVDVVKSGDLSVSAKFVATKALFIAGPALG